MVSITYESAPFPHDFHYLRRPDGCGVTYLHRTKFPVFSIHFPLLPPSSDSSCLRPCFMDTQAVLASSEQAAFSWRLGISLMTNPYVKGEQSRVPKTRIKKRNRKKGGRWWPPPVYCDCTDLFTTATSLLI